MDEIKDFPPEEGFTTLLWADAVRGQEVYIRGTHQGKPKAYGPHTVVSAHKRELRNPRLGRSFLQCAESLCTKEN